MSAQPPTAPPGSVPYPPGGTGYPAAGQPGGTGYPAAGQPGGAGYPAAEQPGGAGYPAAGQPGGAGYPPAGYAAVGTGYPSGQPGSAGYPAPGPSGGMPPNNYGPQAGFPNPGYGVTVPLVTAGDMKAAEANMAANPSAQPSAPNEEDLIIPGYENMHPENDISLPPPAYDTAVPEHVPYSATKTFKMDDDEARDALLEYVAQHCCYGKGAAKKMKFDDIISTSALHYTLETFLETRKTKWAHAPYSGGFVDGPENGLAPTAWEIPQACSALFADQKVDLEVPHTASVRMCFNCFGMGFKTCLHCRGRGHTRCSMCHGSGRRNGNDCGSCHNGQKRCHHCHARGQVICPNCVGSGKLKRFIQLTVEFKNHVSSHVIEGTDLPDELIRKVTGEVVFEQTALYVAAVSGYPDEEIDRKSQEFVTNHASLPTTNLGRVLQQRQKLQCVPVFECHFKYSDDKGRFWVYGLQKEVYTKDYPHTCCCCSIC